MTLNSKNNCFSECITPKLVEKHSLFSLLSILGPDLWQFMCFSYGVGGHFENRALAELAVTTKKGIGAHFYLKGVR